MLLGYDENGDIKFIFTDDDYLRSRYPNNTAKISNFWKVENLDLKELFTDDFTDLNNVHRYKVVDDKLVKKEDCEIKEKSSKSCDIINAKVEVKNAKQEIQTTKQEIKVEKKEVGKRGTLSGIAESQKKKIGENYV